MSEKPKFVGKAMDAFELADLQQRHAGAMSELGSIHKILLCTAECPPVTEEDTLTVKMLKQQVFYTQLLETEIANLRKERKDD